MHRWFARICVLISLSIATLWGWSLQQIFGPIDYEAVYYAARCAHQGLDPYQPANLSKIYGATGDLTPSQLKEQIPVHKAITICINLPTALLFMIPLSWLSWGVAYGIWFTLEVASLTAATFLVLDLAGAESWLATMMVCLFAVNCTIFVAIGNLAILVLGATAVAIWCFVKGRLEWLGICLLALALLLKPQDAGFIWLFFLLGRSAMRKNALKALGLTFVFAVISMLWISVHAPGWSHELKSNIAATTTPGDINDPGPHSMAKKGPGMIVSLQSVVSFFRDDPAFYKSVSYVVCGTLILIWGLAMLRSRDLNRLSMISLAVIVPLSLLIAYHRNHDGKLLLLVLPGCIQLWHERGWRGGLAAFVTGILFVLTGDLTISEIFQFESNLHMMSKGFLGTMMSLLLDRPITLWLLVTSLFYLIVYLIRIRQEAENRQTQAVVESAL